jgi:RNA polymerase sigma-70 factor (ECF subfamily)
MKGVPEMDHTDEQEFDDWLSSQQDDFAAAMREGVDSAAVLQAIKHRAAEEARREIETRVAVAVTGAPVCPDPDPDWPSDRWEQVDADFAKLVAKTSLGEPEAPSPEPTPEKDDSDCRAWLVHIDHDWLTPQAELRLPSHLDSACRDAVLTNWLRAQQERTDTAPAFRRIVSLVRPLAYRYTRAIVSIRGDAMDTADDLARRAMLAMICELPAYQHQQQQRPFLQFAYNVLRREVHVDEGRSCGFQRHRWLDRRHALEPHREDLSSSVAALMRGLEDRRREVLVLRVVVGLSAEETATALDTNPGWVRVQQDRALKDLRRKLSTLEPPLPE